MAIDKQSKDIFKEIKTLEELLKEDLESWDPRTVPAKRMQHGQARFRIDELKKEYEKFVAQNAAAIFVSGDERAVEKFAGLAAEKGGTITVDARGIYLALADVIFGKLSRNQVDFNHVSALNNTLQYLAANVGYNAPVNVNFTMLFDRPFTTKESLVEAIRNLFAGDGLLLQWGYISKEIVDRAFASGATNSPVPCVILNAGEDDKASLATFIFGDRVIDVALEGEVVPYTVTKAFNELKKKLKSNTNTNTNEVSNTTTEE